MARVTVINDSSQFLDLMRELLADLGHEMVGLEAVKTSIEEIVASRPELLVVDLRLEDKRQEVSGWELKKRADDLEQIADVHVRTKPFTLDDMSDLVTRLINGEAEQAAS